MWQSGSGSLSRQSSTVQCAVQILLRWRSFLSIQTIYIDLKQITQKSNILKSSSGADDIAIFRGFAITFIMLKRLCEEDRPAYQYV